MAGLTTDWRRKWEDRQRKKVCKGKELIRL
jgi:hypothetical protein